MSEQKDGNKSIVILLLLILAGESIFFLPFVLARIFRPTLLKVLDITNLELGTCFSIYGLVALICYFFGGTLADRFSTRNLMSIALWLTALGGIALGFLPTNTMLGVLYGYWGFTTIFLFWAAMIRATREWGGMHFQGRAFGLLEGGRGLTSALLGSLALFIFSLFASDVGDSSIAEQRNVSFQWVLFLSAGFVFLTGFLVWIFVPKKITKIEKPDNPSTIGSLVEILIKPEVWMQGLIIVCAYSAYKITDDFSLYANEVLGFDEVSAAGVATMGLWMRPVFAVAAGYLADRVAGTKVIIFCFGLIAIGATMVSLGLIDHITWLIITVLTTTLAGIYGARGIYFAVMQEAKIPLPSTGTAVGIISVLGFTPDIFMSPLMGYLLDANPGVIGHHNVFMVMAIFGGIGLLVSIAFRRMVRR